MPAISFSDRLLVDVDSAYIHDSESTALRVYNVPTSSVIANAFLYSNQVGIDIFNGSDLEVDTCLVEENWELGVDVSDSTFVMHDSEVVFNSEEGTVNGEYLWSAGVFLRSDALNQVVISDDNFILGNKPGNPDLDEEFELVNLSAYNVNAEYNWWGTSDLQQIGTMVYDHADGCSTCGYVDYNPCLPSAP